MLTIKISELGAINSLADEDILPVVDGSDTTTKKVTAAQIREFLLATLAPGSVVVSGTSFGVEPVVGTSLAYAREDHSHGTPTDPMPAHLAALDPHNGYLLANGARALSGTLSAGTNRITGLGAPTISTDAVNKAYVDSKVQGLDWQESVKSRLNAPPASPAAMARYLVDTAPSGDWVGHADEIATWTGVTWGFETPNDGWATWIEDADVLRVFNGSSWVTFGGTSEHGALSGLLDDDHTQYFLADGTRNLGGALTVDGIGAPAIAPEFKGRIYFDTSSNRFRVSEDGGDYVDLVTGGTVTSVIGESPLSTGGTGADPTITFPSWPSGDLSGVLTNDGSGGLSWVADAGGTVTGTGEATRVAFWDGASSLSSNENLFWDNTGSGKLGVGTVSPTSALSVGASSEFQVSSTGDIVAIRGQAYSFPPASNVSGVLSNNGSGTLAWGAVTNSQLADVATATFKGRSTAGTGSPEDLTATQATALLDTFTSVQKGLAPASGGVMTNFLRADGTWAALPPALTGSGVDNQIAVWSGTSSLDGDGSLTWNGSSLGISGALNKSGVGSFSLYTETSSEITVANGKLDITVTLNRLKQYGYAGLELRTDYLIEARADIVLAAPSGSVPGPADSMSATTLTDNTQSWGIDSLVGQFVEVALALANDGPPEPSGVVVSGVIASNTATEITVTSPWEDFGPVYTYTIHSAQLRVRNVADPDYPQDVATKHYVDEYVATNVTTTAITTVDISIAVTLADGTILVDAAAGVVEVILPDATLCAGQMFVIKKIDTSANKVIVGAYGYNDGDIPDQYIDGATFYELRNQYEAVKVQSNGTQFWII